MRRILLIISAALLVYSCCTPKIVTQVRTEYRDSVRVEIRERVVHDTATFEIPVEVERIVTRDTSSRLENSYAVSEAVVTGGLLHHSLRTKPQTIEVPVAVQVRDTTTAHTSSAVEEREEQKIIEVPRELTWWQRTQIYGFRVSVLLLVLWLLWRYVVKKTKIGLWVLRLFKK